MPSVRDQILDEIAAKLNAGRPGDVAPFEILPSVSYEAPQHPVAIIYPGTESSRPVSNRAGPLVERTMNVIIEVRVAANTPLKAADPTLVWITSKLGGARLSTVPLPRMTQEIHETGTDWRLAQRQKPFLAVLVTLEVPYSTRVNDQTATA